MEAYSNKRFPELPHLSKDNLRNVRGIRNANAHAYTSAMIDRNHTTALASGLGTGREWETWLSDQWNGENNTKDHLRDEWNNDVGRQIGRYAEAHDLG
ncbi:hypothetical protein [Ensifer sp. LBL]|uniref:hypothetical protein n=1 Tax=Ensifer sp. LBL TaxID=2991056 RepID=UPI003D25A08C